jgi:diguanylate cyclase (GGDEF)-like protein
VQLVEDARQRARGRLAGREQIVTLGSALGFVGAALALYLAAPAGRHAGAGVAALLVISYAVLSRAEFELASGTVLPTELVLVPMLFLVPPGEVPLLVALGFVLAGLPEMARGDVHPMRVFVRLSYSWYATGPALVFAVARPGAPAWGDAGVYALALGAQLAFDFASSMLRESLGLGVDRGTLAKALARTYLADVLLAPIGLLAAMAAAAGSGYEFLPVLSLAVLLALLATDRREHIGATIVLADAVETAAAAARIDALTGLANRRAWEEHLGALESARTAESPALSVIVADLDNLKVANDTRGHAFGDVLLREAADLLARCVGTRGFVARLGGDELGVAIEGGVGSCAVVLAELEEALGRHPAIEGFPFSLSLGAASSPPEASLDGAFTAADARMYEQKHRARGPAARGIVSEPRR